MMTESNNTIVHSPLELKGLAKYLSLSCHRALERGSNNSTVIISIEWKYLECRVSPSRARDMIRLGLGPYTDKVSTYLPSLIKFGYKKMEMVSNKAFGCSLFEYMQKEENKE
ncbi:unnamed protein product [Rotaria socialis]|uniref:Uncharacterized protein n=1 Tax=Rotaria socialis TaxID=392032 RepID=A0A820XI46_9BILA|nr:unnamed protein product [Rotaria socialis]CAF4532109.1 unnamed protein product [Rotaria socialis]